MAKTVADSEVRFSKNLVPTRAHPGGRVNAGEIMQMMYNAAHKAAQKHSGTDVTAIAVDEMVFLNPLHVGSVVTVHAFLTFTGRTSMEVEVNLYLEDLPTTKAVLTSYFVMVALDEQQRPVAVPALQLTGDEEENRFAEGQRRYATRQKLKDVH
ncbi:MAG: acyl-CoA thioesterase [Sporomusaceae bacterium]|nr:acyl-CoA thioesterase [Sporomusaceae bacterium]